MFHAIRITGNAQSKKFKLAQELSHDDLIPAPDTLICDSEISIGIALIRQISRFLTRKAMVKDKKIVFSSSLFLLSTTAATDFLLSYFNNNISKKFGIDMKKM